MLVNKLKINNDKTEITMVGTSPKIEIEATGIYIQKKNTHHSTGFPSKPESNTRLQFLFSIVLMT